MITPFLALPGSGSTVPRPAVDLMVGDADVGLWCLLDSGSLHNRVPAWVAALAGIGLGDAEPEVLGIGGRAVVGRTVTVPMAHGGARWEAPVSFCEDWPWDFGIAGQQGFLRFFRVLIDAAEWRLEITANT